jgi:cell division protein FtsA
VESRGLHEGYITDINEAARSVRFALDEAERDAGSTVREAYVSIGGIGLEGNVSTGSAIISRADGEIVSADVDRALRGAEGGIGTPANKAILHTIPIEFKIDGKKVYGRPVGMKGLKLEVRALVITALEQHLSDLMKACEEAGIYVLDAIPSPLAASYVSLTKQQRMAGAVLADLGAETFSMIVYENDIPIALEVYPDGSNTITHDLALGLRLPLEEAELVKTGKSQSVNPKKKVADLIGKRLDILFSHVAGGLKKIGKHELLPAGIVLIGSGSKIDGIEDAAESILHLPSRIPSFAIPYDDAEHRGHDQRDPSWYVAYGLTVFGSYQDGEGGGSSSSRRGLGKRLKEGIIGIIKQLTP